MRAKIKNITKILFLALCASILPTNVFAASDINISLDDCAVGTSPNYAIDRSLTESAAVACALNNDELIIEPFTLSEQGQVFRATLNLKNDSETSYRIADFTPQNTENLVTALNFWQNGSLASDFDRILAPNDQITATFDILYATLTSDTTTARQDIALNLSFHPVETITQSTTPTEPTRSPQSDDSQTLPSADETEPTETSTVIAQSTSDDQSEVIPNINANPSTDDSFMPFAVLISCGLILIVVLNRRLTLKQKHLAIAITLAASLVLPSKLASATASIELNIKLRTANSAHFEITLAPTKPTQTIAATEPEPLPQPETLPSAEETEPTEPTETLPSADETKPTDALPSENATEQTEALPSHDENKQIETSQPTDEHSETETLPSADEAEPAERPETLPSTNEPEIVEPVETLPSADDPEPTEPTETLPSADEIEPAGETNDAVEPEQPSTSIESHIDDGAIETPIKQDQEQQQAEEAQQPTATRTKGGYPYQNNCPKDKDRYYDKNGMYVCECVSYAAWRVQDAYGYMPNFRGRGMAYQWPETAKSYGITVSTTPKAGSVGVSRSGSYGHTVWVEKVEGDQVYISHYNSRDKYTNYQAGEYSEQWMPASTYEYIYFDEIKK